MERLIDSFVVIVMEITLYLFLFPYHLLSRCDKMIYEIDTYA